MADVIMSKEWRSRRRHRLYEFGKQSKGAPSFSSLLCLKYDENIIADTVTGGTSDAVVANDLNASTAADQQREETKRKQMLIEHLPKRIRIDLDAELGLKDAQPALFFKQENDDATAEGGGGGSGGSGGIYQQDLSQFAREAGASGDSGRASMVGNSELYESTLIPLSPADEGWYEGTCPARLPEDVDYLSKPQQWARQNIEFFSATNRDIAAFAAFHQRRGGVSPVLGQVGLRCRHCWAASFKADGSWASGSMVFPLSLSTLSSHMSQKLMPHLEDCPNVSYAGKMQLIRLLQQPEDMATGGPLQRAPRPGGVSQTLYYVISARRVGLVDVVDNGIRFGRDLELEPLPFSTIRLLLESKNQGTSEGAEGEVDEPRIAADAESEAVLAEAVAESMSSTPVQGEGRPLHSAATMELCQLEDKTLVTDFLFLTLKQMTICHVRPSYFASRGKKSKMMRLGFAGFCCRWCQEEGVTGSDHQIQAEDWHTTHDASSRSFSSAAESLSSSISNTFTTHLQKCPKVPPKIKKALTAYKKLHHRQMAQLPYGSQTRLFRDVWARMRAADKSEDEIKAETPDSVLAAYERLDSPDAKQRSVIDDIPLEDGIMQMDEEVYGRDPNLPSSDDPETKQALLDAETDWDPSANDNLILPRDRHLVSDYVFLVMRQLKKIDSEAADMQRRPGLACIHCFGQGNGHVTASGRSFPSAPDNFASALNTSLYNHMQVCLCTPDSLKRALVNTRKLHSMQCASIKFGSQRRYFNLLYERLKNSNIGNPDGEGVSPVGRKSLSDTVLKECGFIVLPNLDKLRTVFICKSCRMVPMQFRVANSTFVGKPRVDLVRQHHLRCKRSFLDLNVLTDALEAIVRAAGDDNSTRDDDEDLNFLVSSSFSNLVRTCVGGEVRLLFTFTTLLRDALVKKRCADESIVTDTVDPNWNDLWNSFPSTVQNSEVKEAFHNFASQDGKNYCVSGVLKDNLGWADLLSLMAPSLELMFDENVEDMDVCTVPS